MEVTVKGFYDFVLERQKIWYKKEILRQPRPWTEDPILHKYHFCNVYRELDRGTRWLIEDLQNERDLDKSVLQQRNRLLFRVLLYRLINRPATIDWLDKQAGGRFDFDFMQEHYKQAEELFRTVKTALPKVFSEAYTICQRPVSDKYPPDHKPLQVFAILSAALESMKSQVSWWMLPLSPPLTFMKVLCTLPNVGRFLAYEIWTDLTYVEYFTYPYTDNDFVNLGPGVELSLKAIAGEFSEEAFERVYKLQEKYLWQNEEWLQVAYKNSYTPYPRLSRRNVEHSLCEFRKYMRWKQGKGRKRYYKGG